MIKLYINGGYCNDSKMKLNAFSYERNLVCHFIKSDLGMTLHHAIYLKFLMVSSIWNKSNPDNQLNPSPPDQFSKSLFETAK